jgi:hypothetical protein
MSDWPRFEQVKGPPDTAHEHYFGGRLVGLVFHLIDRRRGGAGAAAVQAAPALDPASGAIQIHERPGPRTTATLRSASAEPDQTHARLSGLLPDESFSRDFLIGSARTRRLQAGLLVALAAVTVVLIALDITATRGARKAATQHAGQAGSVAAERPQENQ